MLSLEEISHQFLFLIYEFTMKATALGDAFECPIEGLASKVDCSCSPFTFNIHAHSSFSSTTKLDCSIVLELSLKAGVEWFLGEISMITVRIK